MIKHQITDRLERLNFHDSVFSNIVVEHDKILINTNWGLLQNYAEVGIEEAILFDFAELKIDGVRRQEFRDLRDMKSVIDYASIDLRTKEWLILKNVFTHSPNSSKLVLSMANDFNEYLEWAIQFTHASFTWTNFILHKNWVSGRESLT